MHTGQGAAEPTQPQDKPTSRNTLIFEWTENRAEEGFQTLFREDHRQRQLIREIINELNESNLFYTLVAKFEDAHDLDVQAGGTGGDELLAFAARIYIAGSLRGCAVLEL